MTPLGDPHSMAGAKDAAAREREDRLNAARKKVRPPERSGGGADSVQLKTYRARQPKNLSQASNGDSVASTSSVSLSKRSSLVSISGGQSFSEVNGHKHRRSISRGIVVAPLPSSPAGAGHGRRASKSRASFGGHNHTRSRASVSIATTGPSNPTTPLHAVQSGYRNFELDSIVPSGSPGRVTGVSRALEAFSGWGASSSSFPSSPDGRETTSDFDAFGSSQSAANLLFSEAIAHATRASMSHAPNRSISTPNSTPKSTHARRASRHNRQSSVSNFRESIEIMSGTGTFLGGLQPGVSSFAATGGASDRSASPLASTTPSEGSPVLNWSNDPAKVLEILKERGRRESVADKDPVRTRQGALEALEGRVAAPSETIDLGGIEEDALPSLSAPSSPVTAFTAQMVGLGLGGGNPKRNSWNTPIMSAGAKGAMDLGMLMEEEEEEDDEDIAPMASTSKRRSASKRRPTSLAIPPPEDHDVVVVEETPITSTFAARPMRLSLSSSAGASAVRNPLLSSATPPQRSASMRSLTLASPSTSPELSSSPSDKRRHSLFHAAAALASNSAAKEAAQASTPPSASRGLRSLSIGGLSQQGTSPIGPSPDRARSPIPGRRTASTSTTAATYSSALPRAATVKRSSISYLTNTSPIASLNSPEAPSSASSQAARRPWRASTSPITSVGMPPAPLPTGTLAGYAFPFSPSHGNFGGFGDLEVDEETSLSPSRTTFPAPPPAPSEDPKVLSMQMSSLRAQIEQLKNQALSAASLHQLEISEVEKKAGEEARGMRMRNSELERQLEEGRVGRRFEVEGLSREVEQAREAMADLTDERDSLSEDVEGWRARCALLEQAAKKDREDEAMAKAQAKLSSEMRDQIYNLVAALEQERADHNETRQEVERLLVENASLPPQEEDEDDEEAAIGSRGEDSRGHGLQGASDDSLPSISSFGRSFSGHTEETIATDVDEPYSKASSPTSGHSSFVGSRGRDSDFGGAAVLGGLQTLAEEDEEEEEMLSSKRDEAERDRLGSGSTGSTDMSEVMPMTPSKEESPHQRSDSFVRHWSVRFPDFSSHTTDSGCSSPRAASPPCASRATTTPSSTLGATPHSLLSPSPTPSSLPSLAPTSPSTRACMTRSLLPLSPSISAVPRRPDRRSRSTPTRVASRANTRPRRRPSRRLRSPTPRCSRRPSPPPGPSPSGAAAPPRVSGVASRG